MINIVIRELNIPNTVKKIKEIIDFNPFKIGDYVVHENYGLGQYEGLEVVKTDNNSNEYMKIKYASMMKAFMCHLET